MCTRPKFSFSPRLIRLARQKTHLEIVFLERPQGHVLSLTHARATEIERHHCGTQRENEGQLWDSFQACGRVSVHVNDTWHCFAWAMWRGGFPYGTHKFQSSGIVEFEIYPLEKLSTKFKYCWPQPGFIIFTTRRSDNAVDQIFICLFYHLPIRQLFRPT